MVTSIDIITEKFINDDMSESDFLSLYGSALKYKEDEYIRENANADYRNIFKKAKKVYMNSVKEMKKLIIAADEADVDVFNDHKDEAEEAITKALRKIKEIPSDTSSTVISVIVKIITELFKWLVPICTSFGLLHVVAHINTEINYYTQLLTLITKATNSTTDNWKDAMNNIKIHYMKTLNLYKDTLNNLEKVYHDVLRKKKKKGSV